MNTQELYKELVNLIAPNEITSNFELKEIVENSRTISLIFEENKEKVPEKLTGKEIVLDGFVNTIELQTFPLKEKTVFIVVRRRRWKEKGMSEPSYTNQYELHEKGMKTTKEFGAFLKEELGMQPDEYNKFWEGLTH